MHCNKCKRDIVLNDIILNPLIIIQKEYLNYENIDSIFIDKEFSEDIQECPECTKINNLKKHVIYIMILYLALLICFSF